MTCSHNIVNTSLKCDAWIETASLRYFKQRAEKIEEQAKTIDKILGKKPRINTIRR